jgi:hypothetical protein
VDHTVFPETLRDASLLGHIPLFLFQSVELQIGIIIQHDGEG